MRAPVAIGVDLGGTQVRAAIVDMDGGILARREAKTEAMAGPERVLDQIGGLIDDLPLNAAEHIVLGIGVSTPGPVDTVSGIAGDIPTLTGFAGFPFRAELERHSAFPVSLENDGIAAAVGEWRFGAGRTFNNLVYMTVSTGIGGGVIADGQVLRGRMGMAGHIGHMLFQPDGAPCLCGLKGCFEAYGSGTNFAARGRLRAAEVTDTALGREGAIDSRAIFAAARAGDRLANALVDEEAVILGRGIASLKHIFSPEIVIMGGGLSQEFERLHPGMREAAARFSMPAFRDVPIVKAALHQNSGLAGAAALVFLRHANE